VPTRPLPGRWNLEHLEHQERNNVKIDQGATLKDIVVARANRSLARTICLARPCETTQVMTFRDTN